MVAPGDLFSRDNVEFIYRYSKYISLEAAAFYVEIVL